MLNSLNFLHIAFLRSFVPEAGVYLVNPVLIASIAAWLILSGVLKSGSPAPNPTTSIPFPFNSLALAVMARVDDGLTFCAFLDKSSYILFLLSVIVVSL